MNREHSPKLQTFKSVFLESTESRDAPFWLETLDMLLIICNKIWQTGKWPPPWTQSVIITLPKKVNLQLCQNYRTISMISHSSKVMVRILLNKLKPQAEKIIKEEQAGFRAGRSATEQMFNLRIHCNTSKAFTMSSWTKRMHSTEFGLQLCVQP